LVGIGHVATGIGGLVLMRGDGAMYNGVRD